MSLLNVKNKAIIELLSRQHGSNSLFMGLLGKNKKIGNLIHKYYTRPIVAADVIGGKLMSSLLGNVKGKNRLARSARRMSNRFWTNETPITFAGGRASVIPRTPLLTAPLGHARDIVLPASSLIGGAVIVKGLSGLNNKKRIVRKNGKMIASNGTVEDSSTNYEVVSKDNEGGFFYE